MGSKKNTFCLLVLTCSSQKSIGTKSSCTIKLKYFVILFVNGMRLLHLMRLYYSSFYFLSNFLLLRFKLLTQCIFAKTLLDKSSLCFCFQRTARLSTDGYPQDNLECVILVALRIIYSKILVGFGKNCLKFKITV